MFSMPQSKAATRRYCSQDCRDLAYRKERAVCGGCGRQLPETARAYRRYCDVRCAGLARRKPPKLPPPPPPDRTATCETCGGEFSLRGRAPGVRFCTRRCQYQAARKSRVTFECVRCHRPIDVHPARAKHNPPRFCGRACQFPNGRSTTISCQVCGSERRVEPLALARGGGKYCSRSCHIAAQRRTKRERRCERPGCRKTFVVSPSLARRKYCNRACFELARRPREFVCKNPSCPRPSRKFTSRSWRNPRFCSVPCANATRKRAPSQADVGRYRRILELHAEGQTARQIAAVVADGLTPENVRKILSRPPAWARAGAL